MALSRNELIARLRTMQDRASKAPMQNVKIPTNQSSYRTPSGPAASAPQPQQAKGTDPATLAKAGSALGGAVKAWANRNVSPYDWNPAASAATSGQDLALNTGELGGLLGMMQGSNVDVAANMAGNTAANMANLPTGQVSMLGNGIPLPSGVWDGAANAGSDLALPNGGLLGSAALQGADAAAAGADAAGSAGAFSMPGAGSVLGAGLQFAQGNYGAGAGTLIGAGLGSIGGPMGSTIGATAGRYVGGLFDR
jgi:hypothetical protein